MSIDYNLINAAAPAGGNPPEGIHTAHLTVAKLVELATGTRLVTEWQTDQHYWTSWHGFEPNRISLTNDYLDGLGVNRKNVTSDQAFEAELAKVRGHVYEVRTSNWSGGINTYIEDAVNATPVAPDAPADTSDFEDRAQDTSLFDDDDIPF